jgi:hypothetical protein
MNLQRSRRARTLNTAFDSPRRSCFLCPQQTYGDFAAFCENNLLLFFQGISMLTVQNSYQRKMIDELSFYSSVTTRKKENLDRIYRIFQD